MFQGIGRDMCIHSAQRSANSVREDMHPYTHRAGSTAVEVGRAAVHRWGRYMQ
jgi:hypothetical protein